MAKPQLIFVAGCNAAGKSTFIRTRLSDLEYFEILMTDVYKGRTKDLLKAAILKGKDIILESVFNDSSFKDIIDFANNHNYQTSLVILFLDSVQESYNRVALRGTQQSGIIISGSNVKTNFNESFKNIAQYYFYFDRADFIYTGVGDKNQPIMSFHKTELVAYHSKQLSYPQKFAAYSFQHDRLNEEAYQIITTNQDFPKT